FFKTRSVNLEEFHHLTSAPPSAPSSVGRSACGEISLQRGGKVTKRAGAAYERQEKKGKGGRGEGWRRERYPSSAQNIGSV
ncbi:MAG: hypothetical protein O7C59_06405, partial [Rickettsia endosymbiont of Ixodes persulcatus]|nr:hypothetical protein [Rickettsia endosymbiont of Ixodes persulcatus]